MAEYDDNGKEIKQGETLDLKNSPDKLISSR